MFGRVVAAALRPQPKFWCFQVSLSLKSSSFRLASNVQTVAPQGAATVAK
jgi:hypothetical protein